MIRDEFNQIEVTNDKQLLHTEFGKTQKTEFSSQQENKLPEGDLNEKYVGKTIKFRGFAVDYSEYLPSGYVAIGKYYISCCAADAEFSGFVVKQDGYNISENSWYEVEGVLELAKDIDGYNIMTIVHKTIKKIKQGDESQYVYQCNNYGDGKCSNLLEYDLGY